MQLSMAIPILTTLTGLSSAKLARWLYTNGRRENGSVHTPNSLGRMHKIANTLKCYWKAHSSVKSVIMDEGRCGRSRVSSTLSLRPPE